MPTEQESTFTPFAPGAVKLPTGDAEKVKFPTGKLLKAHVEDVGEDDFGEGPRIAVKFAIDSPAALRGQRFTKWFSYKATPKSGFTPVALATLGEMPDVLDPSLIKNKPLQVMFSDDTYEGKAYQKATYLPPTEDQSDRQTDVVPEEIPSDDVVAQAMEILGGTEEA